MRFMKRQWRRVDPEIEPDGAGNHHDDQKALGRERGDAGADMGGDKQSGGSTRHRKPGAFQHMGIFSYAESHRRIPQSAETSG